MAKKENYKLGNNIKDLVIEYFEKEKKKENFANARCARSLFEKIKFEQSYRVAEQEGADINLIKQSDVRNVIDKLNQSNKQERIKIGFAS